MAAIDSTPKEVPATTYTLALIDDGLTLYTTSGSATTVTVPPNASVAFPTGAAITLIQQGAGKMTVAAGAGVTINPAATLSAGARYAVTGLKQVTPNVWAFFGNIGA